MKRRPVAEITDRAKRYRANRDVEGDTAICHYCGGRGTMIHHIDGNESHGQAGNLVAVCRPCNHLADAVLKAAGLGRPTNQFNPKKKSSAASGLGQYVSAVRVLRGELPGDVAAAVATLKATSPAARSRFARRVWEIRRERYGPSGRQGSAPF